METTQQALAAHFEECARILHAHPELFTEEALTHVRVVAGLSTRVVRQAARRTPLTQILRDVSGLLLGDLVRVAKRDRLTLGILAGARRGYLQGMKRAMLLELRRCPLYTLDTSAETPTITSACPHCGDVAPRDLSAPAPCQPCGYLFARVD